MTGHDVTILTLDDLVARADERVLRVRGGQVAIRGVCSLTPGHDNAIAFAAPGVTRETVASSNAAAIVTTAEQSDWTDKPVVVCEQPRETFAAMVSAFERPAVAAGVAAHASVADSAHIAVSAAIMPGTVVESEAVIGDDSIVNANAVVGAGVVIGNRCRVGRGAVLAPGTWVGNDVPIGPNTVLGARGFGLVENDAGWERVPQLGGVSIGNMVEIGAGATIDRGTVDDTVIHDDVRIDNQVHIGHNVEIGPRTVIAGCAGIAGSVKIGADCKLGGGVSVSDHVQIDDKVWLTAGTQVPDDITTAGVYSTVLKAMPVRAWWRCVAGLRRLPELERRLRRLENRP
ncbi:UDP-3-O-(3-hydroxymyristoyl)glucosamine N-acyltransferase [Salinisphaera orenii]|uniref:UDP-3-O-(3-hydroxymyristoyl)glucosamine N-acyltransferase n=1 Tax=Salinisphaera orenii TaxID=856731 RepID=UPI0013A600A7